MSSFYGMVEGNRSAATRGGSKKSGFRASAQSYDGSIITSLYYGEDKEGKEVLKCRVGTADGSRCYSDYNIPDFIGTHDEFKALLQLHDDIKNGRVSVVRHRKAK